MKNLKKSIAVLCAFALVMGIFAGLLPNTTASAASKIKITFWEQDDATADKVLDTLIADFMKKNPTITVKRTHYETETLRKQYLTASIGTEAADIVLSPNDNIGTFATAGVITPVDTVLGKNWTALFDKAAIKSVQYDGKSYMVPDRNGNDLCLIYNKKLVPNAPKTFEEVIKISKSLKASNKVDYGFVFNQTEPFFTLPFLKAFGGEVFDNSASKNPKVTLDTPAMKNMLTWMVSLKTDGVMPKECDYNQADSMFKQGKAAFIENGPWSFGDYAKAIGTSNLGIIALPTIGGKYPAPYAASKGYTISKSVLKDSAKKAAVAKFANFMTSGPSQVKMVAAHNQAPTILTASKNPAVLGNKFVAAQIFPLSKSITQPIIPQMRGIWDSVKSVQVLVLSGKVSPADAGAKMQKAANDAIDALGIN
jgi:arabinogalactan oligomer / maltooligosaccharide transport system substrate-binding protein